MLGIAEIARSPQFEEKVGPRVLEAVLVDEVVVIVIHNLVDAIDGRPQIFLGISRLRFRGHPQFGKGVLCHRALQTSRCLVGKTRSRYLGA